MLGGSHDAPWPEAHRTTARCAVLAPDGLCQLQMCCPGSRCAAWAQDGLALGAVPAPDVRTRRATPDPGAGATPDPGDVTWLQMCALVTLPRPQMCSPGPRCVPHSVPSSAPALSLPANDPSAPAALQRGLGSPRDPPQLAPLHARTPRIAAKPTRKARHPLPPPENGFQ